MSDDEFSAKAIAKKRAEKAEKAKAAREAAMLEDPELRAIHMETKQVQQDTLSSTQNSVRTIKETINVADSSAGKLKQQGEQLESIHEKATHADQNATDSYKSARELRKYDGLIPVSFKNIFTGKKTKAREKATAEATRKLDKKADKLSKDDKPPSLPKNMEQSNRVYEGDDPLEKQINENLDEISAGLDHITMQATEMNKEFERQKITTAKIDVVTQNTEKTLDSADRKIQKYL